MQPDMCRNRLLTSYDLSLQKNAYTRTHVRFHTFFFFFFLNIINETKREHKIKHDSQWRNPVHFQSLCLKQNEVSSACVDSEGKTKTKLTITYVNQRLFFHYCFGHNYAMELRVTGDTGEALKKEKKSRTKSEVMWQPSACIAIMKNINEQLFVHSCFGYVEFTAIGVVWFAKRATDARRAQNDVHKVHRASLPVQKKKKKKEKKKKKGWFQITSDLNQ